MYLFGGSEATFALSFALRSLSNELTRQDYTVLVGFYQVIKGAYLQPKVRNGL